MSELKSCVVHSFRLSDADDVEIYVSAPINQWQQTESGKWVMKNAMEVCWSESTDYGNIYCYEVNIIAKFTEKDFVYWSLKYK
jgi:hypothetical protein